MYSNHDRQHHLDAQYFRNIPTPRKPLLRLPTEAELREAKKMGRNPVAVQVSELVTGSGLLVKKLLGQSDIDPVTLMELKAAQPPKTTADQLAEHDRQAWQSRQSRIYGE